MSRAAVFLDRDGVINRAVVRDGKPYPPADLASFEILPGVPEALDRLRAAGFLLIVVTNQPDVARGTQKLAVVEAMHERLRAELPLDGIEMCHDEESDRYKPRPGMLRDAAREWGIDLTRSVMIGDRWRDVDCGKAASCFTVLIDRGYAEPMRAAPDAICDGLPAAATLILDRAIFPTATQGAAMTLPTDLSIKIFADGADLSGMLAMAAKPWVQGFTTNPTLMRKAGITDYRAFAHQVLDAITDRPVSFEVFADDLPTMEAQAREIASWGGNVYVKVPVTNTKSVFTGPILTRLSQDGIKLNVTALMTAAQVRAVADALVPGTPAVISVFAGRIADTGVDPVTMMAACVADLRGRPELELLWASPRELLNLIQADAIGCHIITMTNDLLGKLPLLGKDHDQYSLETVEMFHRDASAAGYDIPVAEVIGAA